MIYQVHPTLHRIVSVVSRQVRKFDRQNKGEAYTTGSVMPPFPDRSAESNERGFKAAPYLFCFLRS